MVDSKDKSDAESSPSEFELEGNYEYAVDAADTDKIESLLVGPLAHDGVVEANPEMLKDMIKDVIKYQKEADEILEELEGKEDVLSPSWQSIFAWADLRITEEDIIAKLPDYNLSRVLVLRGEPEGEEKAPLDAACTILDVEQYLENPIIDLILRRALMHANHIEPKQLDFLEDESDDEEEEHPKESLVRLKAELRELLAPKKKTKEEDEEDEETSQICVLVGSKVATTDPEDAFNCLDELVTDLADFVEDEFVEGEEEEDKEEEIEEIEVKEEKKEEKIGDDESSISSDLSVLFMPEFIENFPFEFVFYITEIHKAALENTSEPKPKKRRSTRSSKNYFDDALVSVCGADEAVGISRLEDLFLLANSLMAFALPQPKAPIENEGFPPSTPAVFVLTRERFESALNFFKADMLGEESDWSEEDEEEEVIEEEEKAPVKEKKPVVKEEKAPVKETRKRKK